VDPRTNGGAESQPDAPRLEHQAQRATPVDPARRCVRHFRVTSRIEACAGEARRLA
jgi:hypothetical protein